MVKVVEDKVSVDIVSANNVESELRDVPGAPWLKWSLHIYPLGQNNESAFIGVFIRIVGGRANVNATFHIRGAYYNRDYRYPFCQEFNDGEEHGYEDWYSNVGIKNGNTSKDKPCTVTCSATLTLNLIKLAPIMLHELIDESKPHCSDARVTIGMDEIKVQRGFLSMISPVFHAMFSPETKESKTGVVKITDFTVATVRNALDYCYGVDLNVDTVEEVIDMLRFYDKYDIQPTIAKLEARLKELMNTSNFAPIAAYAWQYSREMLQAECGRMFHKNMTVLACHLDFVVLDPVIVSGVLKEGLKSTGVTIPEASD
uniref:BTB domain-containing protein n=1 Tax=Panagrellus redivivus TaxID=6233 RepID=A0A7E4ZQS6_PANRE